MTNTAPNGLYAVLGLEPLATTEQIRKAFRATALKVHPDKLGPDASKDEISDATKAFQDAAKAYSVLSDPAKRSRYDLAGSVGDDEPPSLGSDVSWSDYFRELWTGIVSPDAIDKFEAEYKYSEAERKDVLDAYIKTKGALLDIIDNVMLASLDDLDRFKGMIQAAIDAGEVQHYKKFPVVSKRELARKRAMLDKEASQVDKMNADAAENDASDASLAAILRAKNADRLAQTIEQLEKKYTAQKQHGKKKTEASPAKRNAPRKTASASKGSNSKNAASSSKKGASNSQDINNEDEHDNDDDENDDEYETEDSAEFVPSTRQSKRQKARAN